MRPVFAALICLSLFAPLARADEAVPLAIIDTAWDTTEFIPALKAKGVQVIGRYYARCEHMDGKIPQKRLAFRPLEVATILESGMAILSIYQFHSSSKYKFDGMRMKKGVLQPLFDENCQPASVGRDAATEARLDVRAAVFQAQSLGQPIGSAIYFGVDFNFSRADTVTAGKMLTYFRVIRRGLTQAGYRLGVYGDGDALNLLQEADLIDFSWIMASRSFSGSSALHRSGRWDLFQAQVNRNWFKKLPLDLNIQNVKRGNEIGFWDKWGVFALPSEEISRIFKQRRFVCNGNARLRKSARSKQNDLVSRKFIKADVRQKIPQVLGYASAVRIGERVGKLRQVDVNDDGIIDGWTRETNLSRDFTAKPDYQSRNKKLRCP